MKGVLDLFLAQPLGARSLLQRIFGYAISDGIKSGQKSLDAMSSRIDDSALCDKIDAYVNANVDLKEALRLEAREEDIDLMVVILRTERFAPVLDDHRIGRIFNAYVAWNNAVENVSALPNFNIRQLTHSSPGRQRNARRRRTLRSPQTLPQTLDPPPRQSPNALHNRRTSDPATLPRPLHNLLRAPRARLQIRKRLLQRHRLCLLRRRRHQSRRSRSTPGSRHQRPECNRAEFHRFVRET